MKKIIALTLSLILVFSMVACGSNDDTTDEGQGTGGAITVISREDGSGTRGAFIELMGILDENDVDHTTTSAEISQSTSVVMTTVAGNAKAIGYVSLGSLDDSVKAIKVDGVEPSVENIKAGSYSVSRPFIAVTGKDVSDLAKDFIEYIMSAEGQQIISDEGYITIEELKKQRFVTQREGCDADVNHVMNKYDLPGGGGSYIADDMSAVSLVMGGFGVCLMPELVIRNIPFNV